MLPVPLFTALVGLFGVFLGSFLNVLILRLPDERTITGRSECPHCHHQLAWHDLVPVLSFAARQGRCAYCGKPISWRYPVIELATGALFALIAWQVMPQYAADFVLLAKLLVIGALCIAIFIIDLEHYLILDALVYPGVAAAAAANIIIDLLNHHSLFSASSATGAGIIGALAASVPFYALWRFSGGKWMGLGDVKYAAFMGMALGFPVIIPGLFLSFMAGAFVGVILIASGKKQLSSRVPFGTFLTAATVIGMLWGEQIWHAYARLSGLS